MVRPLTLDVAQVLGERLACPRCGTRRAWTPVSRSARRQNSSIHRLRCAQCGEQIAAKVSDGHSANDDERALLQREYATLQVLESAFPQDVEFGTLKPFDCLDAAGHAIMVTRWFPGAGLIDYLRMLDLARIEGELQRAGTWLSKLHAADKRALPPQPLGVGEKIEDLLRAYGPVLTNHGKTRAAYNLLVEAAQDLNTTMIQPVRLHGDFKPQNLLCDGSRIVGLDIQWTIAAAPVYDLAPFLNHLWLAGSGAYGGRGVGHYARAEGAFLAGYANAVNRRALRWAQLYFTLCHVGRYRLRGVLATAYANWKVGPLVRRIVGQLGAVD